MNPSNVALKLTRNEIGVSKHIPITHLDSATIFESNNGMIGSVIHIEGVTFDTEKDEVLNQHKMLWHRALTALDERFCLYVTTHRHKEETSLQGEFKNSFLKDLDARYHEQFQNKDLYTNDLYLTIVYKGITSGKAGKGLRFLQKLQNAAIKDARQQVRKEQIRRLKEAVHQLMVSLSVFKPRLLGKQDDEKGYSEVLSFFGKLVNGGVSIPFHAPKLKAMPIAKSIGETIKQTQLYPFGNIATYLPYRQIFFGNFIQFQGATPSDTTFGAIITIKRYSSESVSIMLDPLLHLDGDFISTHSFAIEAKDVLDHRIQRHLIQMKNVNDAAISQHEALHEARDLLASDQIAMGYHHNTLLLLASTLKDLEQLIHQAIKAYADAGFSAVRETIGQEPAFWAQIPTNLKYIARSSLITSENFVDFCPFHNYRTGYRDGNHLGSAVTLLETPSRTPYFFNYHVRGSKDNPSKGHAIIIGGNNSGKTVFLTFMDAQMSRYGGNTFYFDRDRGAEIYIRACGGYYSILSPDFPEETCFNPLALEDTPSNRQLNCDLLTVMCLEGEEKGLPATITETLKHCVDYAYDQLALEHRTLSNAVQLLPIHFPRWPHLRRFLRGQGKQPDGQYAYLFDNPEDRLNLNFDKMGFDMTHFLDREPSLVRTTLLMYLFHRIDLALTGQRVSLLLDEGWQYFIDPYWEAKLRRWLPTLRKRNGHLVIATQSPSSVVQSPIRSMILDNVATQIFFCNPQATEADYREGFHLSDSEFETVANNPPEARLFLVKQEHDSVLCRLNLGHMGEYLTVLSGNTKTVRILDELRKEVGDESEKWLPLFYERRASA